MKELNSLLFMVGMALSIGSIATFIVMNVVVGSSLDLTLIHHQRLFVAAISRALTIPGVCMLFASAILSTGFSEHQPFADEWSLAQLILAALILINTIVFVRPLVAQVTQLARQSAEQELSLESYVKRKKSEDRFGSVNFLLIVTTLLLVAFKP